MIGAFLSQSPRLDRTAYAAPSARLIGAVSVGRHSSIWFGAVARADINRITIGEYSNIQDQSVLHVADELGVVIGDYVTIGHSAVIHACRIKDNCLVGMGAKILNGAVIGEGSIVAAGSVVCEGFKVPEGTLVMGVPARIVRKVTLKEKKASRRWARKYARLALEYKNKEKL